MMQLNDDCLCLIFSFLNLKEQLILCDTSHRFRSIIVELIWRVKFREVRTAEFSSKLQIAKEEFEKFYQLNIQNMEKLVIKVNLFTYTSYLNRERRWPELSFYFTFDLWHLEELICEDYNFNDGFMRVVSIKCPNLRLLRVYKCPITGLHVKRMKKLEKLYMIKCPLKAIHFQEILTWKLQLLVVTVDVTNFRLIKSAGNISCTLHLYMMETDFEQLCSEDFSNTCIFDSVHLRCLRIQYDIPKNGHILQKNYKSVFENVGCRIIELKLFEQFSLAGFLSAMSANVHLLKRLQKLYITSLPALENVNMEYFQKLYTLKELYLYDYLIATDLCRQLLEILLKNNKGLECIYYYVIEVDPVRVLHYVSTIINLLSLEFQRKMPCLYISMDPHSTFKYEEVLEELLIEFEKFQNQGMLQVKIAATVEDQNNSLLAAELLLE